MNDRLGIGKLGVRESQVVDADVSVELNRLRNYNNGRFGRQPVPRPILAFALGSSLLGVSFRRWSIYFVSSCLQYVMHRH